MRGGIAAALDALLERFGSGAFSDEALAARAEYDERRGRVFEDEELWEPRIAAFQEWYLLERVPGGRDLPLAAEALAEETAPERASVLRALLTSHRSVFEVAALAVGSVKLVDLIGGARFAVSEPRAMHGVRVGDVVETRLVGLAGEVLFARTFVFHPAGTELAIEQHIDRMVAERVDRRDIVDYLASLRVKCERYKHLPAERVYARG